MHVQTDNRELIAAQPSSRYLPYLLAVTFGRINFHCLFQLRFGSGRAHSAHSVYSGYSGPCRLVLPFRRKETNQRPAFPDTAQGSATLHGEPQVSLPARTPTIFLSVLIVSESALLIPRNITPSIRKQPSRAPWLRDWQRVILVDGSRSPVITIDRYARVVCRVTGPLSAATGRPRSNDEDTSTLSGLRLVASVNSEREADFAPNSTERRRGLTSLCLYSLQIKTIAGYTAWRRLTSV